MASKLIPVLLTLALLLAGCLGSTDGDEALGETATPAANDTANTTTPAPLEALLEANTTTGPAPMHVSFSLDGSGANTTAGNLSWTLEPGDDSDPVTGQGLPATVNHTYQEPGTYTATLEVRDGNRTGQANLTIQAEAPKPEEDDQAGAGEDEEGNGDGASSDDGVPDPVIIEGSALVGHPAQLFICLGGGIDGGMHAIDPAGPGWTYALEPADGFALYWWSEDGFLEAGEDEGTVPEEATRVEVCATTGNAAATYTLTLWQPGHPEAPTV